MRSRRSLRQWVAQLLPHAGPCAQGAAWELLRALLLGFTTHLSQLARQLDHETTAKSSRQRLTRWLDRSHWHPPTLYARLLRLSSPVFRGRQLRVLLLDMTDLADGWQVLQVSIAFQGRALPLYRAVRAYQGAPETQLQLVEEALSFLRRHLPGPHRRYVVVMDRGFPSHLLVRHLQATGWRFALRVKDNWKLTHPEHTGSLRAAVRAGLVGPVPRLFRDGVLGDRTKGAGRRIRYCRAHLVAWQGEGHAAPWFVITSETEAPLVIRMYRQRMQIECEFRDLKGPLGLDALARWQDQERVARFLAWMAIYEWRLAYLWLLHRLVTYQQQWQIRGTLSWIRIAREWLAYRLRTATFHPDACL
jgi:hypothetical protein